MDFVRLGAAYSTSYYPDQLIEGYISLIWTERFQDPGEFQLKSYDIDRMKELLPVDTLVSHLETKEVMRVETHLIEMDGVGEDATPVITIAGRSAYAILEDRWVESSYQKKRKMRKKYSATTALCVLLWQAVDNNSGVDVTRGYLDPDWEDGDPETNNFTWTTLDDIPNVCVTEAVPSEGSTRWWLLEQGPLLDQFQKILVDADLGIRTIRPVLPNSGWVINVVTTLASRGDVTRTVTPNISALRFEVYAGTDRTNTVKLSQLQGHIDKPQYLESTNRYKTVAEVMSGVVGVADVYRPGESGLQGWRRRIVSFDAGTPDIPAAPAKPDDLGKNPTAAQKTQYENDMDKWRTRMGKWRNKRDTIIEDFREEAAKAGQRLLKQHRKLNMFAGDVSDVSPYIFNKDYFLGDTVMLVGDYNKTAKMVVQEYIRTEDVNGDRGIPGLVEP